VPDDIELDLEEEVIELHISPRDQLPEIDSIAKEVQ
jgi:hypothetical protein